ncbi:Fic family protein [Pseudomaricurvus alcaniphilus]|nr:Fic family protein [Pseudomaricurvus alcaniphilus]
MKAGYSWLIDQGHAKAPLPDHYAEIRSVTRIEVIGSCIAVPATVAPARQTLLDHVLFALKHEGVNLTVLAQVLPQIPEIELRAACDASPTSQYLRKAGYLWEHFTGSAIRRQQTKLRSNYVPLFDPSQYLTSTGVRNSRWRILFNGLGSLDYCVTVRRTPELSALLDKNLLQLAGEFTESLPPDILNRALAWAYLDETRNSFAIENEVPSGDKANRFVSLLQQAHVARKLDEDYLVALQNAAISNVYYRAASFRAVQNHLSNGLRGAIGVSYVPPEPELSRALMERLMELANTPPQGLDPLVLAAIVSFGFVFIHPFMDGNGRLSRFLFHQVLCQQGGLKNGLLLPVSAVLKQNEADYKATLEAWSAPTRAFWDVTCIDDEHIEFDFQGHPALYRYWDATQCATFMAGAAEQAIENHLKEETEYLGHYDEIYQRVDRVFDVANADLSRLVMFCMDQQGRLSAKRRRQYQYKVPEELFEVLEQAYQDVMNPGGASPEGKGSA